MSAGHPFASGDAVVWADEDPRPVALRHFGAHPREDRGPGPFVVDAAYERRKEDCQDGEIWSPEDRFKVKIGDRHFSARWFKTAPRRTKGPALGGSAEPFGKAASSHA